MAEVLLGIFLMAVIDLVTLVVLRRKFARALDVLDTVMRVRKERRA